MVIDLKEICKDYIQGKEAVPVLKNVNLSVDSGEYLAIMGPSGSGKSTLMNIIGCLDRQTSGNFIFDGSDISVCKDKELSEIRNKKIGFVFQNFNLLPRLSAVENVELPLLYAIARAMVNSPMLLLADEPTGALDTKSGEQVMEIFENLNSEGVTIVMITHEKEIAEHAKRIMYIRDGELSESSGGDSL